jgi:hypothetical protein
MKAVYFKRTSACLICALISVILNAGHVVAIADEHPNTRRGLATQAVREALQHEVYGLDAERARLLAEAVQHDSKLDAAHWQQGQVKDDHGKWIEHDLAGAFPGTAAKLAEYERVRAKHPDTVDGQLAIANWCAKRKLVQQERAHLTHLLEFSPDHGEARGRLGFVRSGGGWISNTEIATSQEQQASAERDLKTWRPVVLEILKDLRHRSDDRKEAATERLLAIYDPAAVPAILELAFGPNEDESLLAIESLAQMAAPEASLAVARISAFAPSIPTREAAVKKLSERSFDDYVPQLLATLYSPVSSRTATALLPNGQIGLRQVFVREGVDRQEVVQLDTQYERVARFGGDQAETSNRAVMNAVNRVVQRQQATLRQNAITEALNERIIWVLTEATKQQFADPAGWWKWWGERNEVFVAASKPVSVNRQVEAMQIADYVPPPSNAPAASTGATPSTTPSNRQLVRVAGIPGGTVTINMDCLAAGTEILTIDGTKDIEAIQLGDLVLSRNQETGELSYKPVVKTTVRPKSPLVRLTIDGETIATSGGHLFWVSGEGWTRSRELQPGMVLHGVAGPARVQVVEQGETAETYNLVVADFNTYFVGRAKVFSHDNTVRQPTRAIVPGLRLE